MDDTTIHVHAQNLEGELSIYPVDTVSVHFFCAVRSAAVVWWRGFGSHVMRSETRCWPLGAALALAATAGLVVVVLLSVQQQAVTATALASLKSAETWPRSNSNSIEPSYEPHVGDITVGLLERWRRD